MSTARAALALATARRAVERRRAAGPRPGGDFTIRLCSPCGGHDDEDRRPRDFGHGFELHLVVTDAPW